MTWNRVILKGFFTAAEVIKTGSLTATIHAFSLEPCQTDTVKNGAAQHTNTLPDQLTQTFDT